MMIAVIFFILASVMIVLGLSGPATREYRVGTDAILSRQSYLAGESGIEDIYYRMLNGMPVASPVETDGGNWTDTAVITDIGGGVKKVDSTGIAASTQHISEMKMSIGNGIAFRYAAEADDGGLDLADTAGISGNVHANGTIHGQDGASISGAATAGATSTGTPGVITGDDATHFIHIGTGGTFDAAADAINYANVSGTMYCTTSTGSTGPCASAPDPAYQALPITSGEITGWETDAETGGVVSGDYTVATSGATLGPQKIVGNLTVPDGATLTLSGTLWVTGNVTVSGTGSIILSSSFGSDGGMVIADGTISTDSTTTFSGSGSPGSYLMLLSNATGSAISYAGTGNVILYAPSGTVALTGTAAANEAAGTAVTLADSATLTYNTDLLDVVFNSGAAGPPSIQSWKQTL